MADSHAAARDRHRERYFHPYRSYTALARLASRLAGPRARLPVLSYHSVCPDGSPRFADHFNVLPATFEEQVRWLADNGYTTITPDELPGLTAEPGGEPARHVLITFDDGYANNYHHAMPILCRYRMKAVFFVASGFLDRDEAFPWVRPPDGQAATEYVPLRSRQVTEMDERGMIIGGHCRSHRRLSSLSPEEAAEDINGCKADLAALVKTPITSFAYPYGAKADFTDLHQDLCRQAGFTSAFTTEPVSVGVQPDLFAVPRLPVHDRDGVDGFALKMQGWFDAYQRYAHAFLFPARMRDRLVRAART